ncbi:MAG: hypothetical protein ACO3GZ_08105 [Ilumatobacteraceae bacterium]
MKNFFTFRQATKVAFAAVIVGSTLSVGQGASAVGNVASTKVTICHRTHSVTNPYRRITVSQSSIVGGANSKHGNESGEHNDWSVSRFPGLTQAPAVNVFSPAHTYTPASDKKWGDIVPNVDVSGNPIQGNFPGLNYTLEGLAIYNGTSYNGTNYAGYCKAMTTKQFIDSEIAAGEDPQDIVDDINDQDANEDKAVIEQLGGTLTVNNINEVATVGAVTNQPTAVTTTSGTLNGEFKIGTKTATSTRFMFGTDATCTNGSVVLASPSSAQTGTAVSASATSLTPGTTYYYKVVGVVDAGTELEAIVEGACVSFVAAAGSSSGGSGSLNLPATGSNSTLQLGLASLIALFGVCILKLRRRSLA